MHRSVVRPLAGPSFQLSRPAALPALPCAPVPHFVSASRPVTLLTSVSASLLASFFVVLPVSAQEATLASCAPIAADGLRLACYDRLMKQPSTPAELARKEAGEKKMEQAEAVAAPVRASPAVVASGHAQADPASSTLSALWETGKADKRGLFEFRPYRENFLLVGKYTSSPNNEPFAGTLVNEDDELKKAEIAFQLSFKMKVLEDLPYTHSDLWFGYTQQSFWQAYSRKLSSPFRETNYQPEVMLVTPLGWNLPGGIRAEFLNLGFLHQSNGRGLAGSRSWNRAYAQIGLEKGDVSVLARIWKRGLESGTDDNPDITDYMGHGDLTVNYRWRGHQFSVLGRRNFHTDRGAAQVSWAFPVKDNLKGYVRGFAGYGESLIDYNYSQKSIGAGFLIDF
jgi:phospholipase A1